MKKQLLIILLGLAAIGCKKESKKPEEKLANLQGSYHSSTIADFGAPVMYTQAGIITDPSIINNYLSRKKITELFTPVTQTVQADLLNINIDAASKVTGRVYIKGFINAYKDINGFIAEQSSSELLIKGNKPDTIPSTYNPVGGGIGKTQPITSVMLYPAPFGGFTISLPQLRLAIKGGELYLSELAYYYHYQNGTSYVYGNSYTYDLLNPDLTKELFSKDTIVVQQRLVKLIK
ncbi:MAG: hypothetical protein WC615_19585 [Mucilaginibacter sp.]|jgi:hypothetical protein|uniref:hypothetical protein n=1 Tax=Mucilaginibacter sp. TaxID=1882438 RepID=UPI0035671B52